MADKFLPCANPHDQVALFTELIITLRAGFGMKPAVYDESKGGMVIPDDYSMPKLVEAVGLNAEELKAEEPEPKAGKAKGK